MVDLNLYWLMIKKIDQTGLKYLCKKKYNFDNPDEYLNYSGSGKLWKRTLKKHPEYTISTELIGIYTKEELKVEGLYYSKLYNIVESKEWANLINEVGDGGRTADSLGYKEWLSKVRTGEIQRERIKGLKVYHNPKTGKVIKIDPKDPIPEGFVKGNMKGRGYGPKKSKTKVVHNGKRKIYISKDDPIPEGFEPGVHYVGTTKNKIGCYDPISKKKKYVKTKELIPEGWLIGIPPTTGINLTSPNGINYDSFESAMREENLTRYFIQKSIDNKTGWKYK